MTVSTRTQSGRASRDIWPSRWVRRRVRRASRTRRDLLRVFLRIGIVPTDHHRRRASSNSGFHHLRFRDRVEALHDACAGHPRLNALSERIRAAKQDSWRFSGLRVPRITCQPCRANPGRAPSRHPPAQDTDVPLSRVPGRPLTTIPVRREDSRCSPFLHETPRCWGRRRGDYS